MTSRSATLLVWAVLGSGVVVLAVLSAVRPRSLPTLLAAIRALVSSPWRRWIVVLGWMWLGWHLFAR